MSKQATRQTVPEGIRITKVGLWYILLAVLVAIPAANTGNNALYMVEACLLSLLVVSGVTSRQNLRKVEITVKPPGEVAMMPAGPVRRSGATRYSNPNIRKSAAPTNKRTRSERVRFLWGRSFTFHIP